MAKRKKSTNPPQTTATPGRSQDKGPPRNSKAMLKLDHLRRLAVWAGTEASIPSLGAFFGRQFASAGETLGVPPDPSLLPCQRCETILQPGFNCTIRIEKNRRKAAANRGGKSSKTNQAPPQNYVIYTCHFCSFRNQRRGTSKGHVKSILPPKPPRSTKSDASTTTNPTTPRKEAPTNCKRDIEAMRVDEMALPAIPEATPMAPDSPRTPLSSSAGPIPLLEALRKKRNRSKSKKKPEESESGSAAAAAAAASTDPETTAGGSRKKRRKSWTSLSEIAA